MKLSNLLLLLLPFAACRRAKKLPESVYHFNSLAGAPKTIIISCTKCGCIVEALNEYFTQKPFNPAVYTFYGDTACLGNLTKNIPVTHLPQRYIDSCSLDFYNILIRYKENGRVTYRQVSTKEAGRLPSFLSN